MCTIQELYDLTKSPAKDYLSGFTYPWEALSGIGDLILSLGAGRSCRQRRRIECSPSWVVS